LILVTYRLSDLQLAKHPFLDLRLDLIGRGIANELPLEQLTGKDIESYLAQEFPGHAFPSEFPALIFSKTEGSPLFMVDMLRYLRDREVITGGEGGYRLAKSMLHLEQDLPASVRSMIERKIGRLSEDDRRLLFVASAQGYEFDSAAIAKALEADVADIEERLALLERVHALIRKTGEEEYPGGQLTLRCRFVHVLYQNALYANLAPTRRVAFSVALAQALVGFYGERSGEIASKLGFLFEAGRDWASATRWFLVAANQATRVSANREAIALAERGLACLRALPDSPDRARLEIELHAALVPMLIVTLGFAADKVERACVRLRELCVQVADNQKGFPALWGLWALYADRGELQRALQLAQEFLDAAQTSGISGLLVEAHAILGDTYFWLGEFKRSRWHCEQGLELYEAEQHSSLGLSFGGYDPAVFCLGHLSWDLWQLGLTQEALRRSDEGLALAARLSRPHDRCIAHFFACRLHQFRRDVSSAREQAESAIAIAAEHGFEYFGALTTVVRGWALIQQGRNDEGLAEMRSGMAAAERTGELLLRPYSCSLLAEGLWKLGEYDEALRAVEEGLAVSRKTGAASHDADLLRLKGTFLQTADPAEAELCFRRAAAVAHEQGRQTWGE
jgi:tetratricopeptide (TPR) repeat protein